MAEPHVLAFSDREEGGGLISDLILGRGVKILAGLPLPLPLPLPPNPQLRGPCFFREKTT